ncbi:MAG: polyprenyl synthetase family protein [Methanocalculus sp. MSAO_Arc1]|uniref:polyprenyl synthetase family protein n=1 Tax=Methanocalculus TaxID=71151 RepID=UPI000FF427C7|nr:MULTISPECIES: polyprenyl synthetase family protein [unclassified Methanocalculus]MCP1662254.1 geranylgeranyl diphosphate synthase type I [Methanocalculus sp. AMF5]RQD81708.1 MAG: polyprenyl synthetase family protein [Methanocalculus sp. MSAO_Arc1]
MDLKEYLESVQDIVDKTLFRFFGDAPGDLNKASAHLLLAGGKRLRPAMVMLAADAVRKGASDQVFPAALALEVTHTFTLVHDDFMDNDSLRRGVPTVHSVWDEATAILAGDVLYARAFELITKAEADMDARVRAISMLAKACEEICKGQFEDMAFEKQTDVSRGDYLDMVRKKTGALYAAAAGIGSILAGGTPIQSEALYNLGMTTGIGFQIQDDIIDLMAPKGTSGKDRASDLQSGKQTLIAIVAAEKGIDLSPYKKDLTDDEIDSVIRELEEAGVITEVREIALDLVKQAKEGLSVLPESEEKQLIIEMVDFFVTRGS